MTFVRVNALCWRHAQLIKSRVCLITVTVRSRIWNCLYILLSNVLFSTLNLLLYNFVAILFLYIFCRSKWKNCSSLLKIDGPLQQRQKLCQLSRNLMPWEQTFLPMKGWNNGITNCFFHLCSAVSFIFIVSFVTLFDPLKYEKLWDDECELMWSGWDELVWGENAVR
jgi:hypothetical protein